MNSKILTIAAVAAAFAASSCDNWTPPVDGAGKVDLKTVTVTNDDAMKIVNSDQIGRSEIDFSGYNVRVYKASDPTTTLYAWTYANMPEVITLPAETYCIGIESHTVAKAEWERPYFAGDSKQFTVEAGKITNVGEIVCSFKNIRVSVVFDEELQPSLGDDIAVTVKANDEGSLVFTANETRSGYFEFVKGSTTMAINFKGTVDGLFVENDFTFNDLEAGQHRVITFHKKSAPTPPDQTGTITPGGVGVDVSVIAEDIDGNVVVEETTITPNHPWQEEPEQPEQPEGPSGQDPEAPTIQAAQFSSDNLDLVGVNNPEDKTNGAVVNISCEKGIAHLYVVIDSESLAPALPEIGLAAEFDLAYPGDIKDALKNDIGLPVADEVINKNQVAFDITKFMVPLSAFSGDHNFHLEVIDNENNKSNLTLKFHVNE